jgi:hypothetical protein
MPNEPLKEADARAIIRRIIEDGEVEFWAHAQEEMAKDGLSQADCLNVLRGGWPDPAEFESGRWRYRVQTQKICVVVQFESEEHLAVVTAWRKK